MSEKKVGKRLLTWVLVLVMALSLLPLNVLASPPVEPAMIIQPDANEYLTYQFYVGGKMVDEQIVKDGNTLLAPETPKAAEGQRFIGWYDENDALFTGFGKQSGITESKTITLHAKFEEVYYVFFHAPGENGNIVKTKEGVTGNIITFEDVTFAHEPNESITGWYTDKNYTNKVDSVTLKNENVDLYAKVETGHWITFDSTGGSYVAPQFVTKDGVTVQPADPTRAGYTFAYWKNGDTAFIFGDALTSDITLTAEWAAQNEVSYTVIHWQENANDDGYSYVESEPKSGAAGSLTAATAKSYEGFTAPQAITQQTIAGDGSTIVNVYYTRNEYTITFYLDNPTYTCGKKEHTHNLFCYKINGKLKCEKEEHTHDVNCGGVLTITAKYGANISTQWPTYDGSSTWRTTPNGGPYQVNIQTMPLNGANFYGPKTGDYSETAYYYAEVLPGESGGTPVGGKYYKQHHKDTSPGWGYTVTKEDQYPITGYTFNEKISTGIKAKYNNAKFYYDRNGYDVVYVNNGKTVNTQSYPFEASIADAGSYTPTRPEGIDAAYVFTGWYADPAGAQLYDFEGKTMPAQNITVYAKWAAPVHTVTFMVGNKPVETLNNVKHNETIATSDWPTDPTSSEGDFLGWTYLDGKPFKADTQITRNLTLTAKFGSKIGYKVTYDTTGGNGTPVNDSNRYGKDAAATVLDGVNTAPTGKVFLYWEDATHDRYYPNNKITINGDVTLTAVYGETPQSVSITYHNNFGTPDKAVTVNDIPNNGLITVKTYEETNLPTREGYTFAGWTDSNGAAFEAGTEARVDNDGENHLYAQWTADNAKITFVTNGGSDVADMNGKTGDTIDPRTMPSTTKNGYTFAGWYANAEFTGAAVTQLPAAFPAGTTTYYAKWTADDAKITFVTNGGSDVADMTGKTGDTINPTTMPATT